MKRKLTLLLAPLALLTGCTSIPKAELISLQAVCPNVRRVGQQGDGAGVMLLVRIKGTPGTPLALDSARALKCLVASTNLATLPSGADRGLTRVEFYRSCVALPRRVYTLQSLKVANWSAVANRTDEELSRLGKSVFSDDLGSFRINYMDYTWTPIHGPFSTSAVVHIRTPTLGYPSRCPNSGRHQTFGPGGKCHE